MCIARQDGLLPGGQDGLLLSPRDDLLPIAIHQFLQRFLAGIQFFVGNFRKRHIDAARKVMHIAGFRIDIQEPGNYLAFVNAVAEI